MTKPPLSLSITDKNTKRFPSDPMQCCASGCDQEGVYRAPKSREKNRDYYWFCLLHIREYNANWDFFSGMSEEQIMGYQESASYGFKPTWSKDSAGHFHREGDIRERLHQLFGSSKKSPRKETLPIPADIRNALTVLELTYPTSKTAIKVHYKKLVKQYHPDLNPHDSTAEERFRKVHEAYKILVESTHFKF